MYRGYVTQIAVLASLDLLAGAVNTAPQLIGLSVERKAQQNIILSPGREYSVYPSTPVSM